MEDNNIKGEITEMNFFKKVWYSITKFEKYPLMASFGIKKAILYYIELIVIFCIVFTAIYLYYISNIAEFANTDLTFSGKIMEKLVENTDMYKNDEYLDEGLKSLQNIPTSTMIITLFISIFISNFMSTLTYVIILSFFGLITCLFSRVSIRYKAIFNMSIYALTLSIILELLYALIYFIFGFEIRFFGIMYMSIGYISLAAAIFMIKSDLIKQQIELIKVMEDSKQKIEEKLRIPKKPKEDGTDEEENNENNKEDNKKDNSSDSEEQGSNA